MDRTKTRYIDLLAVLAAFSIVFLHTNNIFWTYSTESYWLTSNAIDCLFYFAVPCFFMITGATLMDYRDRYDTKTYFKKRVVRVLIPYLFWSLYGLGFHVLYLQDVTTEELTFAYVAGGLFSGSLVSIYWFFTHLLLIYLLIPLFSAVPKENRKSLFSYMAIVLFLFGSFLPFLQGALELQDMSYGMKLTLGTTNCIYVFIGYLLKEEDLSPKLCHFLYLMAVVGLVVHFVGTWNVSTEAGEVLRTYKGYSNVPSILYSVGIFTFFKQHGNGAMHHTAVAAIVDRIKPHTFSLYLLHWYFLQAMLQEFPIDERSIWYRLGAPLVLIPVSILVSWVVKKIPVLRYLLP